MADRVTELSSPPYVASKDFTSNQTSNSIGNIFSHASHGRKKLLMQRGFSVTDSSYSPSPASSIHPILPTTSGSNTATTTSKSKKSHGGGKWPGLLRAPFERTWSVPDQYTSNPSSPASKNSSRSSIEKIISKEEALALVNQQRKKQQQQTPMQQYPKAHSVVIEAPIDLKDQEPRDFANRQANFHPLSSYHYYHPRQKHEVEPVYLDDPLVDLSPLPTTNSFSSHPILPPSYSKLNQEFSKDSFQFLTSTTTSSPVSGNVYSNPGHFQMSQILGEPSSKSQTGTPVEVKLTNIGSPVQFSPFVTTTGSLGGLTGNGGIVFGAKHSEVASKSRSKMSKRRSAYCSTQPNSPTSTRQKILPFLGKLVQHFFYFYLNFHTKHFFV